MRYGANHPGRPGRPGRRARDGRLALTDRDGLYGAVKFALACRSAGIRPVFGVDLAVAPALDTTLAPAAGAARSAQRRAVAGRRRPPGAGPRWGERRPAAAPGHLPRPRRRRLAVAVPADQRHPPARHAGRAGELAGDGRRARRPGWSRCSARTPRSAGRWPPGRADLAAGPPGRLARPAFGPRPAGARGGAPPRPRRPARAPRRCSRFAAEQRRAGGADQRRPLRRRARRPDRRRARRRPPAGRRWTRGTSTGAPPRAT